MENLVRRGVMDRARRHADARCIRGNDLAVVRELLRAVGEHVLNAALQRAELDRVFSTLIAPFNGGIENFTIDLGFYAAAGQPVGTFVSTRDVWIQADMRENNIGNMEIGNRVELALDVAPGRIFRGTVRSIGFGVSTGQGGSRGELEQVSQAKGWLRDPQRFAVIIAFDEGEAVGYRRVGGQANVVVYTSGNFVLNSIAWLRLRLSTLLSYVR